MQEFQDAIAKLDYYQKKQFKPGWQDLISIIFSGIFSSTDKSDARDFLYLIGGNLAKKHPILPVNTMGELEDNINTLLAYFDWGRVDIKANEQEMLLIHYAYPSPLEEQEQAEWIQALSAVLEGLYSEWILMQGGHPHVPLRWQDNGENNQLVFCYKNGL